MMWGRGRRGDGCEGCVVAGGVVETAAAAVVAGTRAVVRGVDGPVAVATVPTRRKAEPVPPTAPRTMIAISGQRRRRRDTRAA
jgi:hypothetical protein